MTIEEAFVKLITLEWELQNKEFKDKYRAYRSKYRNMRGSLGPKIMLEMLELTGKKVVVYEGDSTTLYSSEIEIYNHKKALQLIQKIKHLENKLK